MSNLNIHTNSSVSFIDSLLQQFPDIRMGVLINAGVMVPQCRQSVIRTGDVVVGYAKDAQHGVLQFDVDKSMKEKRFHINGHINPPFGAVRRAIKRMSTTRGRSQPLEGRAILECAATSTSPTSKVGAWGTTTRNSPTAAYSLAGFIESAQQLTNPINVDSNPSSTHPSRIHYGIVASSSHLPDDFLLSDKFAVENNLYCFETNARELPSNLPILLVCGVGQHTDNHSQEEHLGAAANAAIAYSIRLLRQISPKRLAAEDKFLDLFRHQCFDLERPGLRLMRLVAGGPKLDLECHIFQAYMDTHEANIPYEALSYVWGFRKPSHRLIVNGQVLYITSMLYDALRCLRHPKEDRILWVDAICIDQSNVRERGHQVRQMSQIYTGAERVVFWLGSGNKETKCLMECLNTFDRHISDVIRQDWLYDDSRWQMAWSEFEISPTQTISIFCHTQRVGLRYLMKSDWFKRVWILQEVANAKTAIVACSTGWCRAELFALAPTLLKIDAEAHCQAVLDMMPGSPRRSSSWSREQTLFSLLWRFRESQATDARDRIYALLDLATDGKQSGIQADYSKSQDTVLEEIFLFLFGVELAVVRNGSNLTVSEFQKELSCWPDKILLRKFEANLPDEDIERFIQDSERIINVSNPTMVAAADRGARLFGFFLNSSKLSACITAEVALAAIGYGADILRVLLDRRGNNIKITDTLVAAAVRRGPETLDLLLDKRGSKIRITESVVKEAVYSGPETLKHLFDKRGNEIRVSMEIIATAIRHDPKSLKFLLLNEQSSDVIISVAMAEAAARRGPETLGLLLDKRGSDIIITESVVKEAIRHSPETLGLLLDKQGSRANITEEVIEEAVRHGPKTLTLLLNKGGSKVKITKKVLRKAKWAGPETVKLLLDKRGHSVPSLESVTTVTTRSVAENRGLPSTSQGLGIDIPSNQGRVVKRQKSTSRGYT